jgi:Fur family transcriptional regulator, peroxide stress response regulator
VTTPFSPTSSVANRVQEIVDRLRKRGHRLTPQRYAVLSALVEGGGHPSAEQIFQRVTDAYPMMSPATIYKMLDTLKTAGEVLELEFREGPNRYDANIPSAHPHVVCSRCGRIEDVMLDRLGPSVQDAAEQTAYHITGYRLDFYGLCPSCATN